LVEKNLGVGLELLEIALLANEHNPEQF